MFRNLFLAVILSLAVATCGFGAVIGQQTAGTSTDSGGYYGFAFTTPVGGPWNAIEVNFYADLASTIPYALGNLYLFAAPYAGTPAGLAGSGYLAVSTGISGGQWIFDPSVILAANTQYHFYSDANMPQGAFYGGAAIPGGMGYYATAPNLPFGSFSAAPNFLVEGNVVPEPGTFALLGLSLGALAFLKRRSKA